MISQPKSVPELLREEVPDVPAGKQPIRLLSKRGSQSGRKHC